jgi:inorganic pyrophosphatase
VLAVTNVVARSTYEQFGENRPGMGPEEVDDRLLAAAIHSYAHEKLANIDQVNKSILDQVEEFFISYNKSRGKKYVPKGRHGPKHAAEIIEAGLMAFKEK